MNKSFSRRDFIRAGGLTLLGTAGLSTLTQTSNQAGAASPPQTGQEDTSRSRPFILEGDEPPVLLGDNAGPNAVEAVLHALASCLAVGFVYNAAAQGITVESLSFDLEGELDLRGFLGLSETVRPGYESIRLTYRVKSNAPGRSLRSCATMSRKHPLSWISSATRFP